MGMMVSPEQNQSAVESFLDAMHGRFSGSGIEGSVEKRTSMQSNAFARITTPPQHWTGLAKWMRFEQNVNHCAMITGTHFPDGPDERGWEVAIHLLRIPLLVAKPHTCHEFKASELEGDLIPLEVEVRIPLTKGDSPSVPSVQMVWEGADWNEKETWDLAGIQFDGHENMHRVLNPHDSPAGFHPLQRQHKIRYHDYNEMYDDPQGFGRKPVDEGRVK